MTARAHQAEALLPLAESPEAELVVAARSGSEAAVRELIRRLNPRLFRLARGIVGSDPEAEDVLQETYLATFTRLGGFRDEARFTTWITRIAINHALMRVRRVLPMEVLDTVTENEMSRILSFPNPEAELPEAALGRTQLRQLLEEVISALPPDLRLPFVLKEAEGMSILEIARSLSLNPITVKTRLFRARRRLRGALEQRLTGGFDAVFPFGGARCAGMADRVVAKLRAAGRL